MPPELPGEEELLGELVPVGGGDPIPLYKESLLIGRRSNCDIVLEFPNVSSQHCELRLQNGYWHVRDTKSRNGIKINGERVMEKYLHPGDELSIAKHRYEMAYTPSGPPPLEESDSSALHPFGQSLLEKAGLVRPDHSERPPRRRSAAETPEKDHSNDSDRAALDE